MSYTPKSAAIYTNALAGCLAGLSAGGAYDPTPGDQSYNAQMADAYAQQVDVTFASVTGNAVGTTFQFNEIRAASLAYWLGRAPFPFSSSLNPGNYFGPASLIVALAVQGNTQILNQGVDPNAGGSSGGGSSTPTWTPVAANGTLNVVAGTSTRALLDTTGATGSTINLPTGASNGQTLLAHGVGATMPGPVTITVPGGVQIEDPNNPGTFLSAGTSAVIRAQSVGFLSEWEYQQSNTRWVLSR